MVSLHLRQLRKAGVKKFTDASLSVKQEKVVQSHLGLDAFLEIIKENKSFIISNVEQGNDKVSFKTWDNLSGSQIIEISQLEAENVLFRYLITSRPKLKTTLLDYGSNYTNIINLKKIME
jgi:hypothetical protein